MEFEPKDILELMKSVPLMQSELDSMKSSLSSIERELQSLSGAVKTLDSSVGRMDGHLDDVSTVKHSVTLIQEGVDSLSAKMNDISDKYRDVLNGMKDHDRSLEDKHYNLMRTMYSIENNVKDSLNKQELEDASLKGISNSLENLSRRERSVEKAFTNATEQTESLFERIIKTAPNLIAIITFLGYIIYTLIEHKLLGKM